MSPTPPPPPDARAIQSPQWPRLPGTEPRSRTSTTMCGQDLLDRPVDPSPVLRACVPSAWFFGPLFAYAAMLRAEAARPRLDPATRLIRSSGRYYSAI